MLSDQPANKGSFSSPSHSEVLLTLLASLIAEPDKSPTLSGQTGTSLPGPVLTISSDVILPLFDVFAPFTSHVAKPNTDNNQQDPDSTSSAPLELTLRQLITAADNIQDQKIVKDTPPGAKALAALWLVKTLFIQHIPANNHVTGLAAFANLVKSSQLPLGLSVHTIVIASETVLEFGSQTTTKQPQSRAFLSVLAKVCSPKSLIVHMPLADYLPRRPHPDPHYWEVWEHERSIASFAGSLKQSLQHLCVHNIVSQQMLPEVPAANCHYHFAQYPFVQPRISREMAHYGTPHFTGLTGTARFGQHSWGWSNPIRMKCRPSAQGRSLSPVKDWTSLWGAVHSTMLRQCSTLFPVRMNGHLRRM